MKIDVCCPHCGATRTIVPKNGTQENIRVRCSVRGGGCGELFWSKNNRVIIVPQTRTEVKTNRVLDIGGAANPVRDRVKSWDVNHYDIFDKGIEEVKVKYTYLDFNEGNSFIANRGNIVFCLEEFILVIDGVCLVM